MLQSIRDKTHGWIAGIIISLLIFSFALWGIHSYLDGRSVNDVVATVNGNDINQGQLSVAYERLRRQAELQKANDNVFDAADANLKKQALHSLINLQILKQASLNQGYRISQIQVEDYLENMPDFKLNGQFSLSRFQQVLNAALYTTKDFLDLIRTTLLIDQPRLGVIFSSFSLPNEVLDSINLIDQERDIQYLLLPLQPILNQSLSISQDKINNYYNQHLEDFKKPEQVAIEYILVSEKDIMNKMKITDQELKNYYNENTESFNTPAKWTFISLSVPIGSTVTSETVKQTENKANEIYKKIEQGNDLSLLLKQYSLNKDNLSDHNSVSINSVPLEIQNNLLSATQPGQVIQPIRVKNEFLIIKIVDYKKPEPQAFDNVKEQVKETLLLPKSEEQFANMKEKLANITYEHPDSLKPAADALGLSIQVTGPFLKTKGNQDISSNPKVREAAFSNDVLNLQNNSDVIPITADSMVVLRIKSHSKEASLPLTQVQGQIVEKLKSKEMEDKAFKLANEILEKLQAGASPNDIAKQYRLLWNHSGLIGRHSTKVDSSILDVAFDIPRSLNSYAIAKVQNGYAIVGLTSIRNGVLTRPEDYDAFSEQIQNTQGLLEYELYKQSIIKKAKIEIQNTQ
jgi:peptidyl-prolyl cis-trans isomerase D